MRHRYSIIHCIRQVAPLVANLRMRGAFPTLILGKWEVLGGSAMVLFERALRFPIGSPLWPSRIRGISNHSATICRRISPAVNQQWCHFEPKFREETVYPCEPNFNTIWKRHGAKVKRKEIMLISLAA